MTACWSPQNSAHLIGYVPTFSALNHVWFVLPGIASVLPPKAGTHQLCATSSRDEVEVDDRVDRDDQLVDGLRVVVA